MRAELSIVCAVAALGVALAAAPARADTFETIAAAARPVTRIDDVVWALTATCDRGTDLEQRRCRQVRDARAAALTGATLLVTAERAALTLGPWNAATRSVAVRLSACIACAGLTVDGRAWFVAAAPVRAEGAALTTEPLYDNARTFGGEAAATAWRASLDRARIELVVRVPEKRRVQVAGKDGLVLELLAHRVVAPCSGAVALASPASGAVPGDRAQCSAAELAPVEALTKEVVREAMLPVLDAAAACYKQHGQAGKARLQLTVNGDGAIAAYERTGDFGASPTGACLDEAVKQAVFPRSRRPSTTIGYPIVLP